MLTEEQRIEIQRLVESSILELLRSDRISTAVPEQDVPTRDVLAELVVVTSEITGYPKDTLGVDSALEADLGIHWINRMEILTSLFRHWTSEEKERLLGVMDKLMTSSTLREMADVIIAAPFVDAVSAAVTTTASARESQTSEAQPLEPLVRVIARAVEVLGTSAKALRWLNAPVRSLGDQTPVSLLETPGGLTRVEDALGRIERGVW